MPAVHVWIWGTMRGPDRSQARAAGGARRSHQARGGVPRLPVVLTEAWRNVISGTSRAFLWAAVLAVVVGALGGAQARAVVGFAAEARQFRDSGAAVTIVSLTGAIDGAQCDALASYPGVVASGALRQGPEVTLSAMPSRTMASLESTPGFGRLLDLDRTGAPGPWAGGAWVAADLAADLGTLPGSAISLVGRTASGPVSAIVVDGVYEQPDDGRDSKLSYQLIAPVVPVEPFDECWMMAWPDPSATATILRLPLIPQDPGVADEEAKPQISQLNTTLGTRFDGLAEFAKIPLAPLSWAGAGIGLALGIVSIRMRRLELAGALHAGVAKKAVALQTMIETAWWLVLALAPALVACHLAATLGNGADGWPAFSPGVRTLSLAAAATLVGSQLAVLMTREKHLFRYFKNR